MNQLIKRNYSICTLFSRKNTKYKPHCSRKWCKIERFRLEKCLMWWCYNRIWTRWYSESRDSSKTDLIRQKNLELLQIFRKQLFFNRKSKFRFRNLHFWQELEHFRSFLANFYQFSRAKIEFLAPSDKKNDTEKMILIDHSNFKLGLWFLSMTTTLNL